MSISRRSVVQLTFAFLAVGFLALLGIVGMTFWLGERAQVYFDQAIEARDTRGAAVELRSALQTAESSQRGFMLTGNEIYLAPYDTAKTQAQRQLAALKQLLAPYPDTAVPLQRLQRSWSRQVRRDGPDHHAEAGTARRRGAGDLPDQQGQGPDGRGQRVLLRASSGRPTTG